MGAFTGANIHAISNLNREFDRRKEEITQLKEELEKSKREHEAHVSDLMQTSEDKYNELQLESAFLQVEMQNEKTSNDTFTHRIALLEKKCEDATESVASSLFSRFSQEEFKEFAIRTNLEHYELISDLFQTVDDIYETYIAFCKMSVVLEDYVEKREKASKAYDAIILEKIYEGKDRKHYYPQ